MVQLPGADGAQAIAPVDESMVIAGEIGQLVAESTSEQVTVAAEDAAAT